MAARPIIAHLRITVDQAIKALKEAKEQGVKTFERIETAVKKVDRPLTKARLAVRNFGRSLRRLGGRAISLTIAGFGKLQKAMTRTAQVITTVLTVAVVAFFTRTLPRAIDEIANAARRVTLLSSAFGITAKSFQKLSFAAQALGVRALNVEKLLIKTAKAQELLKNSTDKTTESTEKWIEKFPDIGVSVLRPMQKVVKKEKEVVKETNQLVLALKELGLNAKEFGKLPVDEAFTELLEAFAKFPAGPRRIEIGRLFAEEEISREFLLVVDAIREFEALKEAFEKTGFFFDDQDREAALKYNRALATLKVSFFALKAELVKPFLEPLAFAFDEISSAVLDNREQFAEWGKELAAEIIPIFKDLVLTILGQDDQVTSKTFIRIRDAAKLTADAIIFLADAMLRLFRIFQGGQKLLSGDASGGKDIIKSFLPQDAEAKVDSFFDRFAKVIGKTKGAVVKLFAAMGNESAQKFIENYKKELPKFEGATQETLDAIKKFGKKTSDEIKGTQDKLVEGTKRMGASIQKIGKSGFGLRVTLGETVEEVGSAIDKISGKVDEGLLKDIQGAAGEEIKSKAEQAGATITEAGKTLSEAFEEGIGKLDSTVAAKAREFKDSLDAIDAEEFAKEAAEAQTAIKDTGQIAAKAVEDAAAKAEEKIQKLRESSRGLLDFLREVLPTSKPAGAAEGATTQQGAQQQETGLVEPLVTENANAQARIIAIWTATTAKIKQLFRFLSADVGKIFTAMAAGLKATVGEVIKSLLSEAEGVVGLAGKLAEPFEGVAKALTDAFTKAFDAIEIAFKSLVDFMKKEIKALKRELASLKAALSKARSAGSGGSSTKKLAHGGIISGPGSSTSDSILARLSKGEFVVRAAAVQRYGSNFMRNLNAMNLPKFQTGGIVDGLSSGLSLGFGGFPALSALEAISGAKRPITLQIGEEVFEGFTAPEETVRQISNFARGKSVVSAGKKPIWFR